jgi:uncharacterized lipoprotein YmbA
MPRRRLVLASAGLALLAACGTSPTPTLYTLAPVPGTPRAGGPHIIALREISLARYLERPQIVRSSASYQLAMETNDWWGEPLGAMLGRVMIEALSQRLPGSVVLSELGAVGNKPDATVEINVLRLDADSDGTVILRAQVGVMLAAARQAPTAQTIMLKATPPSANVVGEVAAISDALGQLADRIAATLTGG